MSSEHVVTLSAGNFEQEVANSATPVLVDFWAEWCSPCKMIAPVLDEIAADQAGKLKIAKVNVEESPELATRFRIIAIPALLLFKGGKQVAEFRGYKGKKDLEKELAPHLG